MRDYTNIGTLRQNFLVLIATILFLLASLEISEVSIAGFDYRFGFFLTIFEYGFADTRHIGEPPFAIALDIVCLALNFDSVAFTHPNAPSKMLNILIAIVA